ncbi:ubiquitin-activating enzyme E1 C [Angomonas deanei]|nr:ubiquitin-activating enzyme E1 C [Angomonas deanei]|eukprot:EPY24388.1 ubiquitin-activating enzyme E1 C [Angomonas deanei]
MSLSRAECVTHSSGFHALMQCSQYRETPLDEDAPYWSEVPVLVVGSGGLGCELLHLLALSGFHDLATIDMDRIDLSNLNRQFLFQEKDVGRFKSEVAAEYVRERCPGVSVVGVCGRIEDQPDDFYRKFSVVLFALDSVPARRWMNRKLIDLGEWVEDEHSGTVRLGEVTVMMDLGTGGVRGALPVDERHWESELLSGVYRGGVLDPSQGGPPVLPDEHPPLRRALCAVCDAEGVARPQGGTPRRRQSSAHFLGDGAGGGATGRLPHRGDAIDHHFVLGVVKNIVPAVGFTNAIVSSQAVTELLKGFTGIHTNLNNQCNYAGNGKPGLNTNVLRRDPNPHCSVCSPRPLVVLPLTATRTEALRVIADRTEDPTSSERIGKGSATLWLTVPREEGGATEVFLSEKGQPLPASQSLYDLFASEISSGELASLLQEKTLLCLSSTEDNLRMLVRLTK